MSADSLGDRMKGYESVYHFHAIRRVPLVVRIDGRAFHSYTKKRGCETPFDINLRNEMVDAATVVADGLQGFVMAYHQSDEVSFVLIDTKRLNSEPHFGYDIQKVASTTASAFTEAFGFGDGAQFDCRAFTVPEADVPNYFLWRSRDWERNSLSMLCRKHFSAKQLLGKGRSEQHEMLHSVGDNWADLDPVWKNGTILLSDGSRISSVTPSYQEWSDMWDVAMDVVALDKDSAE